MKFDINIDSKIRVLDPKIDNETKMYRLCSPNYSGQFEFSAAKNGGVTSFNVDYTYKPYNPYIHVNPDFKKLYGRDFDDMRGLVCGGDFSISLIDDKWSSFQINNKNYQLIFDREVQNMAFNRRQERVYEAFDLATGSASGAAQGAMTGAAAGPYGAIAGAVMGGAASATGGAIDIALKEARYKENISLKTDLYNYNLANIRALPASLSKATSLTKNYKFWPFLETYESTDAEKEALKAKIRYNGMTVGIIDHIANYIYEGEVSFVKGQIIRLENLPEATDVAYEIYNEILKGVYL